MDFTLENKKFKCHTCRIDKDSALIVGKTKAGFKVCKSCQEKFDKKTKFKKVVINGRETSLTKEQVTRSNFNSHSADYRNDRAYEYFKRTALEND